MRKALQTILCISSAFILMGTAPSSRCKTQSTCKIRCPRGAKLKVTPDSKQCFTSRRILHGPFVEWYPSGERKQIGAAIHGRLNGVVVDWAPNGQRIWEVHYRDGVKHGDWTSWYENGQVRQKRQYANGKQVGTVTYWYPKGHKSREGLYEDWKAHGTETVWYMNGAIAAQRKPDIDPTDLGWTCWDIRGKEKPCSFWWRIQTTSRLPEFRNASH